MAAIRGQYRTCAFLLQNGVSAEVIEMEEGRTPLMLAAANAHFRVIDVILNFTDPYKQIIWKDKSGRTGFHYSTALAINNASYIPHLGSVIKILLNKNISVDLARDLHNRTALMYAAINNNIPVGQLLLSAGADPRLSDSFGTKVEDMTKLSHFKALLVNATIEFALRDHLEWLKASKPKTKSKQRIDEL